MLAVILVVFVIVVVREVQQNLEKGRRFGKRSAFFSLVEYLQTEHVWFEYFLVLQKGRRSYVSDIW
jgi:uncharacterized membrane protein